jgi:hypothetical protein
MADTFTQIEESSRGLFPAPALAFAMVIGIGIAIGSARRSRSRGPSNLRDKRAALSTYLRDHLSGSDAATQIVERLRRTHAGTEEGRLFGTLFQEFQEERAVVQAVLASLGASEQSPKRFVAHASASALKMTAGGEPGELSFFRTVEGLLTGIQGKRCMWRALQSLHPAAPEPGDNRFAKLESQAVRQWDVLERRRLSLASATFVGLVDGAGLPVVVPRGDSREPRGEVE